MKTPYPFHVLRSTLRAVARLQVLAGFWFLLSAPCFQASGQFAFNWRTVDGGGGTSTGGVYSVSGTIGQPDAGLTMTNGQYTVTGGFWAWPQAVQTPGAPLLSIAAAGPGLAQVSWTPKTPGFVLQEALTLSSPTWTNAPSGGTNPVVVPATVPAKFYRLNKP